jgi:hypothetical protein
MTHSSAPEVKRFLILIYVIFGEVPSENTFYSSETYGTFTEEAIIRTAGSLGWTFVDCVKPRLYASCCSDGIDPILSRISQISGSLKYIRDEGYIQRVCDVVDAMIRANRVIWDRLNRYQLVLGFPPWLGGIDHPVKHLTGLECDIPLGDRAMVKGLLACNLEEIFMIKYSWFDELSTDDEEAIELREALQFLYRSFDELEQGDPNDPEILELHLYPEDMLLDREEFPSFNSYNDELKSVKGQLGLSNLDELAESIANGLRFRQKLDGAEASESHP